MKPDKERLKKKKCLVVVTLTSTSISNEFVKED